MATDQASIRIKGRTGWRYQSPDCQHQTAGSACSREYTTLTLKAEFPAPRQWAVSVCSVHYADMRRLAEKTGHLA